MIVFMFLLAAVAIFRIVEGPLVMMCNTFYLRRLMTCLMIPVNRPFKPELLSGTVTPELKDYVLQKSFGRNDGTELWMYIARTKPSLKARGAGLATKWNLANNGKLVESIEVKIPWSPIFIWAALIFVAFVRGGIIAGGVVSLIVLLVSFKAWRAIQQDRNPELKHVMDTLLVQR